MGFISAHSTSYSGQQLFGLKLEKVRDSELLMGLVHMRNAQPMSMLELEERLERFKEILNSYED